jgi:hypothetical protein
MRNSARHAWASESRQQLRCSIDRFKPPQDGHLETASKLLKLLEGVSTVFSKCALKSLKNQPDFDSAIRRFDPSRPSHLILLVKSPSSLLHLEMAQSAAR